MALEKLRECILDLSNPVAKRNHAAFLLRTNKTLDAAMIVGEALLNKADGSLMRHELAYILGQMGYTESCNILSSILSDEEDDVLVRHESAEALGAIGSESSLDVLKKFQNHSAPEISETCKIAIDLIAWRKQGEQTGNSQYLSVDPAPPFAETKSLDDVRSEYNNMGNSMFNRYRAMFTLRNMNNDEAAIALLDGFKDSSALFRHEVAYVLGQMQRSVTADGLIKVLQNKEEHRMVRHEAAEALGAIGGDKIEAVLEKFKVDEEEVVVDSCVVALDTMDYWNSNIFD